MRRTATGDAGTQLLLTEAHRQLESARADGFHRVRRSDEAVGRPRGRTDRGPVGGPEALVRRLWGALTRPRRICVE
jgi:hypothetical protein